MLAKLDGRAELRVGVAAGKRRLEHDAHKPVQNADIQANIEEHSPLNRPHTGSRGSRGMRDLGPRFSGRRLILALVTAFVIGLMLMATVAESVWAAIELAYYRGAATNNAVFLEWATVREVNINGFEILCKRVNDPETAYHPIGSRIALGSATSGATYNFDVTSGLIPGERYCFRLREITSDQTPGEAFDLCGYGLGLTPPPTTAPVAIEVSIPVTLTPTVVAVTPVPGLDAAPTLAPTADPFAPPTPIPPVDPFATPTPTIDPFAPPTPVDPFAAPTATIDPFAPPTPTQPVSELATPTATTDPAQQSLLPDQPPGVDEQMDTAQLPPTEMPFEEPTATPTETPTVVMELATETPTATATLTTTVPVTISQEGGAPLVVDANGQPVIPDHALAAAEATPTPIYMVVTATPTPLAAAVVAPTFTPWPTAVPTASFALTNLLVPNTQNLMVGLLCLIFVSASGLGALGLVTSVLYMRSQTRRDRLPGPIYDRRRY